MLGSSAMGIVSPTIPFFLKAAASAQHVLKVLDEHEEPGDTSDETAVINLGNIKGDLMLKEVSFCYPARPTTTVLDCLTLSIPANKTTAVVGPSGSGKSTIIGLIERWYNPAEGSMFLDGVDFKLLDTKAMRDQIGVVQQVSLSHILFSFLKINPHFRILCSSMTPFSKTFSMAFMEVKSVIFLSKSSKSWSRWPAFKQMRMSSSSSFPMVTARLSAKGQAF
jgi:hypothetical protein